jgi:hypothetical protein
VLSFLAYPKDIQKYPGVKETLRALLDPYARRAVSSFVTLWRASPKSMRVFSL